MKTTEAKELIEYIVQWQFICMGITDISDAPKLLDISKYSLQDIIKANKIIEANNKRKRKISDYHKNRGHKTNGITINMVLSDRTIAAVYTAMSFTPNGEMIAIIDNIGVGCVRANYK